MKIGELYQIGLPIDRLSNVHVNWSCYEPRQRFIVYPSEKTEDWAVIETRHMEFAAAVIKDVPEAKVKILDKPVKVVNI